MSRSSMNNVNDSEKKDDVIYRTTIGITKDTDIQDNVKHWLELQIEVGIIAHVVNGKSMLQIQLRKEKRWKRTSSIYEENFHLKPATIENNSSVVTPSYNNILSKNIRWYNKSLMDGEILSSPPIRVSSLRVSTLLFTEDINLKRSNELKKKVLRRLIDNTSPTSEQKKKLFVLL